MLLRDSAGGAKRKENNNHLLFLAEAGSNHVCDLGSSVKKLTLWVSFSVTSTSVYTSWTWSNLFGPDMSCV